MTNIKAVSSYRIHEATNLPRTNSLSTLLRPYWLLLLMSLFFFFFFGQVVLLKFMPNQMHMLNSLQSNMLNLLSNFFNNNKFHAPSLEILIFSIVLMIFFFFPLLFYENFVSKYHPSKIFFFFFGRNGWSYLLNIKFIQQQHYPTFGHTVYYFWGRPNPLPNSGLQNWDK